MTDRYSELTRAAPGGKKSATQEKNLFLDDWIIPFGIPSYAQTANGPQIVSDFFSSVRGYLRVKRPTTTAYH